MVACGAAAPEPSATTDSAAPAQEVAKPKALAIPATAEPAAAKPAAKRAQACWAAAGVCCELVSYQKKWDLEKGPGGELRNVIDEA